MKSNPRKAWDGLKKMLGCAKLSSKTQEDLRTSEEEKSRLTTELNTFYARFEDENRGPVAGLKYDADVEITELFTVVDVRATLQACKPGKAPGPDHFNNTLLKNCASELAPVIHKLHNIPNNI